MRGEYYPNIAELSEDEVAKQAPFGAKWRLLAQVEVRCYILISNISGSVKVAPLQILQFPVILPHKFQDAEKFNLQFSDFSEITETADKLRWLRYQKGLRQRDVADYRKTLSALRTKISIIENNLREKDYTFDYSKQPSKAMFKYRKAFMRNDGDRYDEFMSRVAEGTEQLHTGTLTPYEMIKPFFGRGDISDQERKAIDATWKTQEDFTGGENALVVIDGSGSMYGGADPIPATVALSLGIYYAERNTGAFQNHFITFSENPKLVEIKGKDIYEKVRYCHQFNEVANTNIQRVFELILKTAVKNRVPQKDMPAKIFIISDMEFDYCTEDCSLTNFEYAQRLFEEHGYQLPEVMFWNVASRNQQQPVKINDQGVALVSGCNPRIFSMLKAGILSPYAFMMDVLGSERYAAIVA